MPILSHKVTIPSLRARKGKERIAMVTAYDASSSRLLEEAGVEVILVGDSLGMVVLGQDTTLEVTLEQMLHHTRAAARGRCHALLVADMPYLTYQVSREEAVRNAGRFIQEAGAESVKIEGGARRVPVVEALLDAEIPVMGHIGLTPQSFHRLGGFHVQGRDEEAAQALVEDARALDRAGVWSIVLECVPADLARRITEAVQVPTIGIGAGAGCDGQVLVFHDLLGLGARAPARFVRRYAEIGKEIVQAVSSFVSEVKDGSFPSEAESYGVGPAARATSR